MIPSFKKFMTFCWSMIYHLHYSVLFRLYTSMDGFFSSTSPIL